MLPPRQRQAEQEFLAQLQLASQAQIERAISSAIAQKRPALASQLFLLMQTEDQENPDLQQAKKALGFSFLAPEKWQEIEDSWERFISRRHQRMRERHRDKNDLRNRPWKRR